MAIRQRGTVAHVAQERNGGGDGLCPEPGRVRSAARCEVKPMTPAALPPMPAEFPRNRLGLARWLLLPSHPLTARVTVNRYWQEIFGTGLVRTAGDFGVTGEMPSHPGTVWTGLRWSTAKRGWDTKKFFKMLVTSATYRQAATGHAGKAAQRPGEPPAIARPALPHGRRNGARLRPRLQRPAGRENRRTERQARTSRTASGKRWR